MAHIELQLPNDLKVICCYDQIIGTFYYGIFGDFKLVIDKSTGYFNATKLCDSGTKRFKDWLKLDKSKKLVEYYQTKLSQVFATSSRNWRDDGLALRADQNPKLMYEVKSTQQQITGTYVPKELILDIASWVSIEFYDKCNTTILNYFINQEKMLHLTLENKIKLKEKDNINELKKLILDQNRELEKVCEYMRFLGISLEEVKDQNEELLNDKLGASLLVSEDKTKYERFILLKRNHSDYYPYYIIQAQDIYTTKKLKTELRHFPNLEILLDLTCNSNSKTLYKQIKESLKSKGVTFDGNNVDLGRSKVTEKELKEELKVINNKKLSIAFDNFKI